MDSSVITRGQREVPFYGGAEFRRDACAVDWFIAKDTPSSLRRVCVILTPEDSGGFSAEATQLPGVYSQGNTEVEAAANVREAITAAIESYMADNAEIPWMQNVPEPSEEQKLLWVVVDVQAS